MMSEQAHRSRQNRTEFTVSWPGQGLACFRSSDSELVLSDVYWRWIYESLSGGCGSGRTLPFVEIVERGFNDPASLVETIPVDSSFLEAVRKIDPNEAPPFARVIAPNGAVIPTPAEILGEFERLIGEGVGSGGIEMEIE